MKHKTIIISILLSITLSTCKGGSESGSTAGMETSRKTEADMLVREPDVPELATLDSIAVGNPLQARAMQQLNRGYNITNWLEQGRFDAFKYDESYVAFLAAAGFKSLRLPIDLDQYADTVTGTGDGMKLTVNDDLWLILDSFEKWTAAHGLSLTIDYHQYDASLNFTKPDVLREAVLLWQQMAKHFATNPRDDLYFELLNEPALSAGNKPSKTQWTDLANNMIAAIRAHDTKHTIIFGDIDYYEINHLIERAPLSDNNIVYAFHFYEPFIFTHQGAGWVGMTTTHDLPYPYDPNRWSTQYADLGFSRSMESWILSQAQNYYSKGNRAAMFNVIAKAKRWAVDNNVPVICNEFGVYDATSDLQDRVRYYTDLIDIFEELEIPWQHWFMILNPDGTVIPEYVKAFGLGEGSVQNSVSFL